MSDVLLPVKEIPQEVITDATKAFQTGFALLKPYLQALTVEDRRKLFKMSDGTEPFAGKTVDYAHSNPEFVSGYMNVESMNAGFTVYNQLAPFCSLFTEFSSLSCDTRMIAGAQVLREALKYYNTVQTAVKNRVAGAKAIFEDLKKRFVHRKSKKVMEAA